MRIDFKEKCVLGCALLGFGVYLASKMTSVTNAFGKGSSSPLLPLSANRVSLFVIGKIAQVVELIARIRDRFFGKTLSVSFDEASSRQAWNDLLIYLPQSPLIRAYLVDLGLDLEKIGEDPQEIPAYISCKMLYIHMLGVYKKLDVNNGNQFEAGQNGKVISFQIFQELEQRIKHSALQKIRGYVPDQNLPGRLLMIESYGCERAFLPLYSPNLNPIETWWAAIKEMSKKAPNP